MLCPCCLATHNAFLPIIRFSSLKNGVRYTVVDSAAARTAAFYATESADTADSEGSPDSRKKT